MFAYCLRAVCMSGNLPPMPSIRFPAVADKRNHTVAFRLTDSEYLELLPFFEACQGQPTLAMRWLLSQPETRELMRLAVAEATATRPASPKRNGKAQLRKQPSRSAR